MSGAVIDASVALKWALDDQDAVEQAIVLRDRYLADPLNFPLLAPTLWIYEIVNGLWVAVRRQHLPQEELRSTLDDLLSIGVELVTPYVHRIAELALSYDLAAYDAAYLAVAEETGMPLWVGDRTFFAKVLGRCEKIRWIGDFLID
ncbi:MAG: PIN domain-containing protein [Ammonifex sp.]|nr:MAG: PIN domain-containing protein [Ammonifex sp.]